MKLGRGGRQRAVNSHWTMTIQWYRRCLPKFVPLLSCHPPVLLYGRLPGGLLYVCPPAVGLRFHLVEFSLRDANLLELDIELEANPPLLRTADFDARRQKIAVLIRR